MVDWNSQPILDEESERVRDIYERGAPRYNTMIGVWEQALFAGSRRWACEQAYGDVLEAAIGTASNIPWYPHDVKLTGIDVSESMLDAARILAETLDSVVTLPVADAQRLPFDAASFDTVVATLTMCSNPESRLAAGEMARALRPGGQLCLGDHVASPNKGVRGSAARARTARRPIPRRASASKPAPRR